MQRIITNEELSVYLSKLQNQSKDFKKFLYQYVTGDLWIRSRGEEDINIWKRLEGDELEVAKNIIISELKIIPDISYIRAVSHFRDSKATPVLKELIKNLTEELFPEKLLAAKVLYDWGEYKNYPNMLEYACKNSKGAIYDYLKVSIFEYISCFDAREKEKYLLMLNLDTKY
jgi:hypothetical protein